jgi:hypothetical protein
VLPSNSRFGVLERAEDMRGIPRDDFTSDLGVGVGEILEWPRRSLTSRAGGLSVSNVATVRRRV